MTTDRRNLPDPISPLSNPPARLTRREMLNYAWLASLGVLTVNIAGIGVYFALPRPGEGEFGGVFKAGPLVETPAVGEAPVNYPEGKFWLVRTPKGLLALYKVCTHLDCLFNWDEQAGKFVCPCHGSLFDRDGTCLSGPASRSLDRFVVQLVSAEGQVLAETDTQTGSGLSLPVRAEEVETVAESLAQIEVQTGSMAGRTDVGPEISQPDFDGDVMVQVDTGRRILGQPV